jgi:hypothetical protein
MLVAGQALGLGLLHYLAQEFTGHVALQETVAILREHRHVPHRFIQVHPDEPPEQHAVVDLFHQQPLAAD